MYISPHPFTIVSGAKKKGKGVGGVGRPLILGTKLKHFLCSAVHDREEISANKTLFVFTFAPAFGNGECGCIRELATPEG